jgi:hypothetical protein
MVSKIGFLVMLWLSLQFTFCLLRLCSRDFFSVVFVRFCLCVYVIYIVFSVVSCVWFVSSLRCAYAELVLFLVLTAFMISINLVNTVSRLSYVLFGAFLAFS